MSISEALEKRRSIYAINKDAALRDADVVALVEKITRLVPDAFDMKSQRVVVAFGDSNTKLWDAIYDAFGGKVDREKIDGFAAGAGTVLFFTDQAVVETMQQQVPDYAENFPLWSQHANGMLQISIWSGLAEEGVGATIQHYNPVIDNAVRELFDLPETWKLVAQMPFGGIVEAPQPKDEEDISERVRVFK